MEKNRKTGKILMLFLFCVIVFCPVFVFHIKKINQPAAQIFQNIPPGPISNSQSTTATDFPNKETSSPPVSQLTKTIKTLESPEPAASSSVNSLPASQNRQISAVLFVNEKKYEITLAENSSVFDLMQKLKNEADFSFNGQNYSSLGFFVQEINGIKNNPRTNQYWFLYVNNKKADQGASSIKVKANDIITWKYENSF